MGIENRIDATVKNIEGKVKEAIGDLTGDTKTEAEGMAQQREANVIHAQEDLKDQAKKVID
ncbi:MAG: CsbD family protein [Cyanobacteria bacterium P01_A01_bin.37]